MKKEPVNFTYADFEPIKNIALTFPGTEESVSHENTPSIKVRRKLMCRLHKSGQFVPIRLNFELRDKYLDTYPELFHLPEHYKSYPYICMWLPVHNRSLLTEILELSWKELATKKQIHAWEAAKAQ